MSPFQVDLDAMTVARAQRGDRAAQTEVLRRHSRALRHLVSRVRAPGDLDDQMQDLYAKILVALPKYKLDGAATFSTWVYSVAHHFLIDQRRRPVLKVVELVEEPLDEGPSPYADAQAAQQYAALDRALLTLPEEQRRIFVLAQLVEQPLEVIAELERVPLGTVKSRLHRARAQLMLAMRDHLEPSENTAETKGARHVVGR